MDIDYTSLKIEDRRLKIAQKFAYMQKLLYLCSQIISFMKKQLLLTCVVLLALMPMMADDVVYITTEQFRDRIFD